MYRLLALLLTAAGALQALPPHWAQIAVGPPARYHYTRSGNDATDGAAVRAFLLGSDLDGGNYGHLQFACGSIIELEPGKYAALFSSGGTSYSFYLYPQAGCSGPDQVTQIITCPAADAGNCGTSLAAIPALPTIGADLSRMAHFQASRGNIFDPGATLSSMGPVNNYALRGLAFSTNPDSTRLDHSTFPGPIVAIGPSDYTLNPADFPHDIELDRILIAQGEEIAYGPKANNSNPDAFFRMAGEGLQPAGYRFNIHDSSIVNIGGFLATNTTTVSLSSCTAGATTQCTATGIAATLGMGASGDWVYLALSGADGNWAPLNGLKKAYYVNANTVLIKHSYRYRQIASRYDFDSSLFGSFSGAVTGRWARFMIDPSYGVLVSFLKQSVFENNYIGAQWPFFSSGGAFATSYATVQSGSDSTHIKLDGITGNPPAVGDLIGVPVDPAKGQSSWCQQSPPNACANNPQQRIGKVTAVSHIGTLYTATVVPHGPSGIDVAPRSGTDSCMEIKGNSLKISSNVRTAFNASVLVIDVSNTAGIVAPRYLAIESEIVHIASVPSGNTLVLDQRGAKGTTAASHAASAPVQSTTGGPCTAQWDGEHALDEVAFLRTHFDLDADDFAQGKGTFENKDAKNTLVDGTTWASNSAPGNYFIDGVNQCYGSTSSGVTCPWVTASNLHFSNNLAATNYGSSPFSDLDLQYGEETATLGANSWMENNLFPETMIFNNAGSHFIGVAGTTGGLTHNTYTRNLNSTYTWEWLRSYALANPGRFYNDDYRYIPSPGFDIKDNLMSFGRGATGTPADWNVPSGWQNASAHIFNNLFIADTGAFGGPGYDLISDPSAIRTVYPGNNAASPSKIGWAAACTAATWQNCYLDPGSPYAGTASDGGDPGVDILQLRDHINNWSRGAGLIAYDLARSANQWYGSGEESQWIRDSNHWSIADTSASATFTIANPLGSCSVHLYTNRARTSEHADTRSGNSSCNRAGNTVVGSMVTFAFGKHAALSSDTTYYPVFADGARVMTAVPFTTSGAATAPTITTASPLPGGTVNIPYVLSFAANGTAPVTWTATGLPGWATLSATGALGGTPDSAMETTLHVTAANSAGSDGPRDFFIKITPPAAPLATVTTGLVTLGGAVRR